MKPLEIDPNVQSIFRDICTQLTIAQIQGLWIDAGLTLPEDPWKQPGTSRISWWQYFEKRALIEKEIPEARIWILYENALAKYVFDDEYRELLVRQLAANSIVIDEHGRFHAVGSSTFEVRGIELLPEPKAIQVLMLRMENAPYDQALLIGQSKNLIESVTRQMLPVGAWEYADSPQALLSKVGDWLKTEFERIGIDFDVAPLKRLGSSVHYIGTTRNSIGDGHGSHVAPEYDEALVRLIRSVSIACVEYLLGQYARLNAFRN